MLLNPISNNDLIQKWMNKPYYSLDCYLKTNYGEKIYKIALNGGMTCPNRDGTIDTRGCIFCSAGGSGEFAAPLSPIHMQIEYGKSLFHDKKTGIHYIAYFQSYSNTYAPIEKLSILYEEALKESSVAGLSIATRPDCIHEECIDLLLSLKGKYPDKFIWIELGLQTIHEKTAEYIRRGYSLSCFDETMTRLRNAEIPVVAHMIIGLPSENIDMNLATVAYLNQSGIFGIKFHMLHVLRGTDLALQSDSLKLPTKEEYIDTLIQCIEHLNPNIVIHRLTGDGPKDATIAPLWSLNKRDVLNTLHREMRERNTWQGRYYN